MNFVEALLLEMSLDDIHDKYYNDIPRDQFDAVLAIDPTFNNEKKQKMGQYGKWLLDRYKAGEIDLNNEMDLHELKDQLGIFDSSKNSLPADKRDIGQFKSLKNLMDFNNEHEIKDKSDLQLKLEQVPGVRFIGSNGTWEIYSPTTWEASKTLRGDNAVWCTGRHENPYYFNNYTRDGKLYIFINKEHAKDDRYNNPYCKLQACVYDKSVEHVRKIREFRDANNDGYQDNSGSEGFIAFIKDNNLYDTLINSELKDIVEIKTMQEIEKLSNGEPYIYKSHNEWTGMVIALGRYVRRLIIKDGVKIIPDCEFQDCWSLQAIVIPASVKAIGKDAFNGELLTDVRRGRKPFILKNRKDPITVFDSTTREMLSLGSKRENDEELIMEDLIVMSEDFDSSMPTWARNAILASDFRGYRNDEKAMGRMKFVPINPERGSLSTDDVVRVYNELRSKHPGTGWVDEAYGILILHSLDGGMFNDDLCIRMRLNPKDENENRWYSDDKAIFLNRPLIQKIEDYISSHEEIVGGFIDIREAKDNANAISKKRAGERRVLSTIPEQNRFDQFKKEQGWNDPEIKFDKSGYIIPSTADIEKRFIQLGKKNYTKTLDFFKHKLEKLLKWEQEENARLFSNVRGDTTKKKVKWFNTTCDGITSALEIYNSFINKLEKALTTKNPDKSTAKAVDAIFKPEPSYWGERKNMEGLRRALSRAEEAVRVYNNNWNPELTEEVREIDDSRYYRTDPTVDPQREDQCPFCGSTNVTKDFISNDYDYEQYEVTCNDCGGCWTSDYSRDPVFAGNCSLYDDIKRDVWYDEDGEEVDDEDILAALNNDDYDSEAIE